MSFYFRRRVRLTPTTWANVSKTGGSVSARAGRVTVNSRGRVSLRLGRGLSFRIGGRR